MGFLDAIEKLINEHGSATILRERIALANDKYAQLESALKDSEARCAELGSRTARLETELQELRARNGQMERDSQSRASQGLDDIAEGYLLYLTEHDGLSTEEIAGAKDVGRALAEFHLEELKSKKLVSDRYTMGSYHGEPGRREWCLNRDGRAYLAGRGLLR